MKSVVLCSVRTQSGLRKTKCSSSSINISSSAPCECPEMAIRQSFIQLHLLSKSVDSLVNLWTFATAEWNLSGQTEPFLPLEQQPFAVFKFAGVVILVEFISVVAPYYNLSDMGNGIYGFSLLFVTSTNRSKRNSIYWTICPFYAIAFAAIQTTETCQKWIAVATLSSITMEIPQYGRS